MRLASVVAVVLLGLTACGRGYHPDIDRSAFSADVTNPWFPLKPGTTLVYEGTKDGEKAHEEVTTLNETRTIEGVPCRVVRDLLYLDGKIAERTLDYYTQDEDGNVWYFGEDTAELEDGKVTSREGTWHAGRDGAQPGIFMDAKPKVGVGHRQEFYKGHAEDQYEVTALSVAIRVPYGRFRALRTKEFTALEPDVLDAKFYVRGIGQVRERSIKGGAESLDLVSVKRPT
jgi:hypothetical protein